MSRPANQTGIGGISSSTSATQQPCERIDVGALERGNVLRRTSALAQLAMLLRASPQVRQGSENSSVNVNDRAGRLVIGGAGIPRMAREPFTPYDRGG